MTVAGTGLTPEDIRKLIRLIQDELKPIKDQLARIERLVQSIQISTR